MNTHLTRHWMKLCAIGAFLAFGSGVAVAQGVNVSMVTHFALTGVRQAGESIVTPIRIANRDILSALNATGRFNFRSDAQIILLSFEGNLPTFAVRGRNGSNVTTTDISSYFYITEPREVHSAGNMAGFAIYIFTFDNRNGTSFSVSGMTFLRAGTIIAPGIGPLTRDKTLTATVNGPGRFNGDYIALHGTVNGGSAKAEVE